jgi:hypothetical protein
MFKTVSSHQGSAILISLIILTFLTIVTTVFLERVFHFSESSEGIESSNVAYYNALGLIEEQLMDPNVTKYTPWNVASTGSLSNNYGSWRQLLVSSGSSIIPQAGKGNSTLNSDYNIISLGEPLQLVIPPGIDWNNVFFEFRVPSIAWQGTWVALSMNSSGVILWTIGYTGASLFASGETQIFKGTDLNTSTNIFASFSGVSNTGSFVTITDFYTNTDFLWTNGAYCTGFSCTLKLSMIRPVLLSDGRTLPFLEYRINFSGIHVPTQYMTLESTAYAYKFLRTRTVRIPQITTNTALDFAVLQ